MTGWVRKSSRAFLLSGTLAFVIASALVSDPASAQTEADKAAAQALFEQARGMMESGDYKSACEKLNASNKLDPGVGTLLFLGDCYERAKKLASAWRAFQEAKVFAEERHDERASLAEVRAAALKPRLVYIVINVAEPLPEGLEVRANGRVIEEDQYGAEVPIDEGPLSVVARAPGFKSAEVTLDIVGGATVPYSANIPDLERLRTEAVPANPAAADGSSSAPPATPVDDGAFDGSGQKTAAYIIGGVGVASLVVSGVFSLLAVGNDSDSKGECAEDDPNACSIRGKSLRDDALSQASVATVAGIVGTVGLAAGVTLYLTAPDDEAAPSGFQLGYQGFF